MDNPFFYEYTSDGDEQNFSMISLELLNTNHVYDDYEFDPWECYGGVEGELHMQLISYPSPTNEQPCFDKNHVYEKQTVLTVHAYMISSQPTGGSKDEEQLFKQQMPLSFIQSHVLAKNIKQPMGNFEAEKVTFYQSSMPFHQFHDHVNEYMELHFSNALEPANFIILLAFGGYIGDPKDVFIHSSHFSFFLWIICSEENNYVTKQFECLWWKLVFN
jgi:hypothetical protein